MKTPASFSSKAISARLPSYRNAALYLGILLLPSLAFLMWADESSHPLLLPLALLLTPLASLQLLISFAALLPRRQEREVGLSLLIGIPILLLCSGFDALALWNWTQGSQNYPLFIDFEWLSAMSRSFFVTLIVFGAWSFGYLKKSKSQSLASIPLFFLMPLIGLQCLDLFTGALAAYHHLVPLLSSVSTALAALVLLAIGREVKSPMLGSLAWLTLLQGGHLFIAFMGSSSPYSLAYLMLMNVHEFLSLCLFSHVLISLYGTHPQSIEKATELAKESEQTRADTSENIVRRVSHELRTPLNTIVGLTEVLKEELSLSHSTHPRDDIQKINTAAWQLVHLVDDMLELATLPRSSFSLHETCFDAERFSHMVQKMGSRLAETHLTQFQVHCPSGLGAIYADESRLLQICMNLVRNSLRYTRDGKITLHLYPVWERGEARLQIDIRDNGKGMTAFELASLYEAFALTKDSGEDLDRLNLILPITRRLCGLINARLHVESSSGLGTTYSVSFVDRMSERRVPDPVAEGNKKRALLFDSGLRGNEEILSLLTEEGVEVCRIQKASSGLRAYYELTPDFVLMDGRKGTEEKWEVIASIRQRNPHCPIFLINAKGQPEDESRRIKEEITELCRLRTAAKG